MGKTKKTTSSDKRKATSDKKKAKKAKATSSDDALKTPLSNWKTVSVSKFKGNIYCHLWDNSKNKNVSLTKEEFVKLQKQMKHLAIKFKDLEEELAAEQSADNQSVEEEVEESEEESEEE